MSEDVPTHINDVSDTSYWVAYYRAVESDRTNAMFHDPFAKRLVGERGKLIADSMEQMGRYTEWAVISRTVIIDEFIEQLISEGVDAVLNLGAGLDTRPYRMSLPANLPWIEVDYARIIAHKNRVLENETPVCQLSRVVVDLADDIERKRFFSTVLKEAKKVLVITEGVIPYLSPEQVSKLSADLVAEPRFAYWITEYFSPLVYPQLKKGVRTKKMRNAPFLFYPDDWFGFFRALGWKRKDIRFSADIARRFGRRQPMPWYARLLIPLMLPKMKQRMGQLTGYTVFERN